MIRFALTCAAFLTSAAAWAEIQIQEVTTPSGITVWLVEDHSIPFTALEFRFRGGTSLDDPEALGAVNLMTGLLEEGAGDLDARGFAEATEALAASFRYDSSDDEVSVSARFLTENRAEAVALLRASIKEPRFDEVAVERVRRQVLAGLASDATDPDEIASAAFRSHIYGDHPYSRTGKGTSESVAALTRDDLLAAHTAVFARDRVYVGAVGDITPDAVAEIVDTLLADLPQTGTPLPDRADLNVEGGITVVPFDTPQSVAIFGHGGIKRDDPDFFAAVVLSHILGGSGESRLMQEVRVKRGLTYGVYAYVAPKDHAEIMAGGVASANDRVADAIDVISDEWRKMAETGGTAEEVEAAKTYLTGAYPLRFTGNARIARIIVSMQTGKLPIDYVATRNDRMNAVTVEDVNRVAARLMDPDNLHFVVVGQPTGLDAATVAN